MLLQHTMPATHITTNRHLIDLGDSILPSPYNIVTMQSREKLSLIIIVWNTVMRWIDTYLIEEVDRKEEPNVTCRRPIPLI
ncbi:NUDIX hydrolase [Paenibacillus alvei]|uniref:NUDIX hydrolase n=1 Tax=Paenibacillus alvei TaxID=44250 RepID=A0A383RES2_PAEAL|nr:NUDIX hydrolase [Paenibacillus alvei]